MLLRQRHPQPRLTIPLADQKLADQVTEMQTLNDEVEVVKQQTKADKERVKAMALEVENIRIEATEAQKAVDMLQLEEDDTKLVPLYDWSVSCHSLHRIPIACIFLGTLRPWNCNVLSATLKIHILLLKMNIV